MPSLANQPPGLRTKRQRRTSSIEFLPIRPALQFLENTLPIECNTICITDSSTVQLVKSAHGQLCLMILNALAASVAAPEIILLPAAFKHLPITGCHLTMEFVSVGAPSTIRQPARNDLPAYFGFCY